MNHLLKRIIIVFLFFFIVCGCIIYFASNKLQKSDTETLSELQSNTIIESEIQQPKKDYEELNNVKAKSTTNLNLRDEPNQSGNIILTIPKGDIFDLQIKYNSGWYKIVYYQKERLCIW